ncbi:MerR family transcriptional regulator [Parasediminibacterium sp. JCM 36343]|uniref:MerR family transcriptional regulator n=1 Tax=Parasediminibacterium sp. JCM 36343 TaxID=3374279 RepID=UPI0039798F27
MNVFTIKDLEKLSGIKAHTIRIWEQRYALLKPQRTDTNIRYYTNEELKTVLNISLLNKYGFKISHIDRMSATEMSSKILSLSQNEAHQERTINLLIQYMIDLKIDEFENLLDSHIQEKGLEKTIISIVFTFLEKIGLLWQTNHINPAQEHLISNIIRQKLIMGIEKATSIVKANTTALLFLPEAEYHEVGLLFMHYLFKAKGIKVLYVGANVPLKDIEYLAKTAKPTFLYTHLTAVANNFSLEHFLLQLSNCLPNSRIVVSGQLVFAYKKKLPATVSLKKSLAEVLAFIATEATS